MKLGKRKCKNCGEVFQKERPLQSVCCFNCAAEQLLSKQKKDNAAAWKVKKARLKESLRGNRTFRSSPRTKELYEAGYFRSHEGL